jgi:PAS domain S-box-containing protein
MTDGLGGSGSDPRGGSESAASGGSAPFREFAESLPDGVLVVDARGIHREVNETFCRLVGYDRRELIGTGPLFPYVAESDREACDVALTQAVRGESSSASLVLVKRTGEELFVSLRAGPANLPLYGARCAIALFTDTTARSIQETELRDSERRWRSIVENPFDFVVVIDRSYRYVFVNHTAPGIRKEELIGRATPLDFVEPEYQPVMKAAFDKAFREGVATSFEVYSASIDQWVLTVVGPIFEDGEVTSLSLLGRDISAAKRAERAHRGSQKLEMLGLLADGVAHDFGNSMTPIAGNVELLLSEVDRKSPIFPRLVELSRATARAGDLMNRFVLFEQTAPEAVESFNVATLVEEAVAKIAESLPLNVQLSTSLADECPRVQGVPWQIQQALENLCDNARRALAPRGGRLFVSVAVMTIDARFAERHRMRPGAAVRLVVRDDGPGMAMATLAHAFEPFFSTWREQGCSGLGLPMVQAIMTRHQGAVVARGAPGDGLTVELYLPTDGLRASRPAGTEARQTRGRRVLCIDDEAPVLKLTQRVLERAGHMVVSMTSPVDALGRLEKAPGEFDLVITDQTMPRLTGAELAEKVRQFAPDLPFVMVSGFLDPDLALPKNVWTSLEKPVPVEVLLRVVADAPRPK